MSKSDKTEVLAAFEAALKQPMAKSQKSPLSLAGIALTAERTCALPM